MRNSLIDVKDTWWGQVIERFKFDLLINASYSGSRVSGISFPAANTYERINALHNDNYPDIILVYFGYNDFGFCVPIESDDTTGPNPECFYDAYKIMLGRLKEKYPNALIICGTLMLNYIFYRFNLSDKLRVNRSETPIEEYNKAIRRACIDSEVVIADLYSTGIKCDTLDGSHGTKRGHKEMANAWIEVLPEIL